MQQQAQQAPQQEEEPPEGEGGGGDAPDELDALLDAYAAQAAAEAAAAAAAPAAPAGRGRAARARGRGRGAPAAQPLKSAAARREEGLAAPLGEGNKGFALLAKMGYQPGRGVGREKQARTLLFVAFCRAAAGMKRRARGQARVRA